MNERRSYTGSLKSFISSTGLSYVASSGCMDGRDAEGGDARGEARRGREGEASACIDCPSDSADASRVRFRGRRWCRSHQELRMPRVSFESLPPSARIWIFAAERPIRGSAAQRLLGAV